MSISQRLTTINRLPLASPHDRYSLIKYIASSSFLFYSLYYMISFFAFALHGQMHYLLFDGLLLSFPGNRFTRLGEVHLRYIRSFHYIQLPMVFAIISISIFIFISALHSEGWFDRIALEPYSRRIVSLFMGFTLTLLFFSSFARMAHISFLFISLKELYIWLLHFIRELIFFHHFSFLLRMSWRFAHL